MVDVRDVPANQLERSKPCRSPGALAKRLSFGPSGSLGGTRRSGLQKQVRGSAPVEVGRFFFPFE